MKTRMFVGGCLVGATVALAAGATLSQDHAKQAPGGPEMDPAAMMDAYMKMVQPGEMHKRLASHAGTWNTEMKMWMDPNAPPSVSHGKSRIESVLDGRFIQENADFVIDMMGQEMPMQGIGMTGYDNVRQQFVGSWCDSLGTHLLTMQGNFDQAGKVLTMYGTMDEALLGVYGRMVRYQTHFIDHDTFRFEMYDLHAGEDFKVMEITYRRAE